MGYWIYVNTSQAIEKCLWGSSSRALCRVDDTESMRILATLQRFKDINR